MREPLSREGCLALLLGLLTQPLVAALASPPATAPVLIGLLATGHLVPAQVDMLEKEIRTHITERRTLLTVIKRESGFVEATLERNIDELAARRPAVLVCFDLTCAAAAKARLRAANLRIPIVFLAHADPLAGHLIESYAHPGNDITGVTTYRCVDAKMLEMLVDSLSTRKRIGYLVDAASASGDDKPCVEEAQRDAARLQVELLPIDVSPSGFAAQLPARLKSLHLDAVLAPASTPLWENRRAMVQALNETRLPAIYESDIFLAEGGLMSYGPVRTDVFSQLAKSVSKILRGESAGDIPVDQPTLFEFVMNLRAPHFADFGVKATALRRADRILE